MDEAQYIGTNFNCTITTPTCIVPTYRPDHGFELLAVPDSVEWPGSGHLGRLGSSLWRCDGHRGFSLCGDGELECDSYCSFGFILLTLKGSHREGKRDSQASLTSSITPRC